MNRISIQFLSTLATVVLVSACGGGSSGGTAGNGGSAGSAGSAGMGGSAGMAGMGGMAGSMGGSAGAAGMGGAGGTAGSAGMGGTAGMGGAGGSAGVDQCLNAADQKILMDPMSMVQDKVTKCGQDNLGQEPATLECIKMLGLTDGCSQCFDDTIHCVIMNCLNECISDPGGMPCAMCRATKCDPAFAKCSGIMP